MNLKKIRRINPQNKEESNFYFALEQGSPITLDDMATRIGQSCSISPSAIKYVLAAFLEQLPYFLQDGHPIRLDPFCTIKLSLSSKGKATVEELTKADITDFHIIVSPSLKFKKTINSEEFRSNIKIIQTKK